jgi:uncharacterized protein (DUF1499 family)
MTGSSELGSSRRSWAAVIAVLGAAMALAAALVLVAAPLGYRAGLWPLATALLFLPRVVVYDAGIVGAAISLVALVIALAGRRRRGWAALAVLGIVLGAGSAYLPWRFAEMGHALPSMNDITTDTSNPPAFEAVMPLREAAHAQPVTYGANFPALQKQAFPDIAPAHLDKHPDQAFAVALDAARKLGWTIVAADGERDRIEATDRTFWYGFTDDIVVRVSADGSGSRIDVRSKSRLGRGDFGTNARRVRAYLAAIKSAGGAP